MNKLCRSFLVVLALSVSPGCFTSAKDVPVIREGKAVGAIVIPPQANPQIKASAEFLQKYLTQATGATLPIENKFDGASIHLGETDLVKHSNLDVNNLGKDGFILKRINDDCFAIVGGSDWGTEFGVYEFLERYLGVRWLAATELFTEVPKRSDLFLPGEEITKVPVFLSRELYPINVISDPNDAHRASAPLWYRLNDEWGRVNKLMARVEFHHNLEFLFPPSRFGKTHPEFYPVLDGHRFVPPDDKYFQWQPNFSAPDIAKIAAEEIINYFDTHPEKDSYSLGINDSYRFDESPESRARRSGRKNSIGLEDASDDYYQWANEVVDFVHEKYPGKRMGLLAYLQVLEPPTRIKVSPYIVPFITYENTRWENPEYRERVQRITLSWGEAAPNLGWYDYVYGAVYLVPRFFPHAEKQALEWGSQNQVRYYYAEALPNWGEGPNLWVLTKLLWDPSQDVDALLDDWYRAAVGPEAAPKLRAYYEIWEKFWSNDIITSRWYSAVNLWHDYTNSMYLNEVPLEYLSQSDRLLDEAVALADTPTQKARAEALRRMWKVYRASVLARQGDELWKTADLQSEGDVEAYLERCSEAISHARERLRLMSELSDDPLFGHAIYRFTLNTPGEDWGAASLWPLLPWVGKNEKVRRFLESLASITESEAPLGDCLDGDGNKVPLHHQGSKVAREILAASRGEFMQLLENPSFENARDGWSGDLGEVVSGEAAAGKFSLRIVASPRGVLIQSIPYSPGSYIAKVSVRPSETFKEGRVGLSLVARNDSGEQIGPLLPVASAILRPGKWSTLIIPFTLGTYSIPATKLEVVLDAEGLSPESAVSVDDFGVFQVDNMERKRQGAGPDGM